jgi:hypothetical protein
MPTKKAPPKQTVRSKAVSGKPTTPSGSGTLVPQPRGNAAKALQAKNSRTAPRDWDSVTSSLSDRDRKRMSAAAHSMGDNFHAMGDFLFRPDLGADPERGTGPRNTLPDQRLYQGAGNGKSNGKTAKKSTARSKSR